MKRCFVFAAGSYYGLRKVPEPGELVIAADAGYLVCQKEGIVPDLLLGDFDSMAEPKDLPNVRRVPVEKNDTDTMLALKEGLARGCAEFYVYGGTGGKRLDHTLANLQALIWLRENNVRGYLEDDNFVWTAMRNETLTVKREVEWGLFSAFCFGPPARGVDEVGFQYPLHDAVLYAGEPLAVSNHILEPEAAITVRDGTLVVGWELPPRRNSTIL